MIKNLGKYAHPPKGGKMKTVKGMPITGGKTEMRPKMPSTSLNTTAQMAQQIATPPAPFKSNASVVNQPVQAVMPNGPTTKHTAGLSGSKAPAHPPKQYNIKTKGKMVGVNFPGPKKVGKMTASATKGGHSLLYGD